MPEIGLTPGVGLAGAPLIGQYSVTYPFGTFAEKARSIAYLTSFDVTSRFTGGLNLMPFLIFTVTDFLSGEISGGAAARSGGFVVSDGLYEYGGRGVA